MRFLSITTQFTMDNKEQKAYLLQRPLDANASGTILSFGFVPEVAGPIQSQTIPVLLASTRAAIAVLETTKQQHYSTSSTW